MAHVFIKTLVSNHHTEGHRCFEIDFQAAVRDFQSMLVCPLLHGLHPRIPFCVITLVGFEWFRASARCGCALKLGTLRRKSIAFLIKLAIWHCFVLRQCVTNFETHPCWRHDVQLRLDIGVINPRGASNETYIEAVPGRWGSQGGSWVGDPETHQMDMTVDGCMDMYAYCICFNMF